MSSLLMRSAKVGTTAAVGLALWTSFAVVEEARSRKANRQQLLESTGLQQSEPRLERVLGSDPDTAEADARAALALVADLLDIEARSKLAPAEARARIEQQVNNLDHAERLAARALGEQPFSWRGLTARGAAIYLRRSFRRDDRLIRSFRDWESPLLAAIEIAPRAREPKGLLGMAYLEVWPMLSSEKRELARSLIVEGMTDPSVYQATIDAWLSIADDEAEAIEAAPPEAWVYQDLRSRLLRRRALSAAVRAHERYRSLLIEAAQKALTKAQQASRRGDHVGARKAIAPILASLPTELTFLPAFEDLVPAMPAGQAFYQPVVKSWLDFNTQQCLRSGCVLSQAVVQRFLPSIDSIVREASARLSIGQFAEAETLEPQFPELCSHDARQYWLQKAVVQLDRGDVRGARQSSVTCTSPGPREPNRLLADRLLSSLRNPRAAEASSAYRRTAQPETIATRTEIEFALPAGEYDLVLTAAPQPDRFSLVKVMIDGATVASSAIGPNGTDVRVRVSASGSPQLIEFQPVAGSRRVWTVNPVRISDDARG